MKIINRIVLLVVAVLASIQIVSGIDDYGTIPIAYYTFSYGIFLISALLMLLMGVDIIEHDIAALAVSSLPIGFSMGLISAFMLDYHLAYSSIVSLLYGGLIIQKLRQKERSALLLQVLLHGLTGLVLFIMPLYLLFRGTLGLSSLGISVGTGLVAISGMALGLLKSGKAILTKDQIYLFFPGVFLVAVLAFSIGTSNN